jgi:hypothetical protein
MYHEQGTLATDASLHRATPWEGDATERGCLAPDYHSS